MKKLLLSGFLLFAAFNFTIYSQGEINFVELWAHFGENAPEWFTDGSEVEEGDNSFGGVERGIAYSDYSGHVYVSSRHAEDTDDDGVLDQGEPHVYVLDPMTGEAPAFGVANLLTTGITSADENFGGGYPLNNVVTTEDGSIIACNMTLASGPDIIMEGGFVNIKAFRVYRWSWEQDIPTMVIDFQEGGYRLGDKISVFGNWDTEAVIYAAPGESNKLLRWTVTAGVVSEEPEVITLQDISNAGTSITVADVPSKDDWIYVSGRGFMPTLFTTEGVNLTQVAIDMENIPGTTLAGRTKEYGGKLYMAMFNDEQNAFIFDISKHGENVTNVDIIGSTPSFGTEFENAYGEGAVDLGIIDNQLHVFVCAPSNGIAAYRIDGLETSIEKFETDEFQVKAYPNPASEYAKIQFTLPQDANGHVSVKLFDLSGKFMGITPAFAEPGQQEIQVNTSSLPAGTYVYRVVYGNKYSTGKIIKK